MTTINDIAKKAGVAKSTVSNVFSKKKYVSPEICERVMKICKELDFKQTKNKPYRIVFRNEWIRRL